MEGPRTDDEWETLYRSVYPRLLAYASRRLDRERAADAVNETMARAVARIDSYRPIAGVGVEGWLFGICRHVVLDAQRAAARAGSGAGDVAAAYALPPPLDIDYSSPLDRLLSHEEAAALRRAFAELSDDDRELLELRVIAGLSSEETAAVLGKRPGAVRMAQSRALDRLRRLLEEVHP